MLQGISVECFRHNLVKMVEAIQLHHGKAFVMDEPKLTVYPVAIWQQYHQACADLSRAFSVTMLSSFMDGCVMAPT